MNNAETQATGDWLRFFLVRLPAAILAVGIVVEVLALAMSGVAMHRHNVDDLAAAVQTDHKNYPVVLFGDSVTHMVVHKYRVGEPGEVADLTTHAAAGLPSSLFLLRRYLASGHQPKLVLLVPSIHTLTEPMAKAQFAYYLTTVFTQPWEKDFLINHYADYVDYRWKPAAFNMTTRLGEPLFSLIRHPGTDIWISPAVAADHPVLEHFPEEPIDGSRIQRRVDEAATIRPENLAILGEFAKLSRQHGFELKILWPPMYPRIRDGIIAAGRLAALEKTITGVVEAAGSTVTFADANTLHGYQYFDHDLIHIKGDGWEQTYANDLSVFINNLMQAKTAVPAGAQRAPDAPLSALPQTGPLSHGVHHHA